MNSTSFLSTVTFVAAVFSAAPAFSQAHDHARPPTAAVDVKAGSLLKVTEKDAAWAAKERANYPLDVCVASGEKLGSMGDSPDYIYRVDGQPDRLVVLCCDGCEEDFLKEPAQHLAKIDAAKGGSGKVKGDAKHAPNAHP